MAASFVPYLKTACRDVPKWVDNCSAQNKNWPLLTALLHAVNTQETVTKCVTLNFFELGHTAMAADAVHRALSQNLKMGDVMDFADYVSAVEPAKVQVKLWTARTCPLSTTASAAAAWPR